MAINTTVLPAAAQKRLEANRRPYILEVYARRVCEKWKMELENLQFN